MSIKKLITKQRLTIIISIGLIVLLIMIYTAPSEVIVTPSLSKETTEVVKSPKKAVMPIGPQSNKVSQIIRDPFTVPPEYKAQTPAANGLKNQMDPISPKSTINGPTSIGQATPLAKDLFKLTGIVSTNNQHVAIIQTANRSKAYYLNEFIGAYQLIAILEDSIILTDHDNQLLLPLESANQKGDNRQ
jgi:type II secretory pathway component PulC